MINIFFMYTSLNVYTIIYTHTYIYVYNFEINQVKGKFSENRQMEPPSPVSASLPPLYTPDSRKLRKVFSAAKRTPKLSLSPATVILWTGYCSPKLP